MNQLMKIGNQEISVKEYQNKRVVTFKDIDCCHERPEGTAKRNFNTNRKHFIESEDFFFVKPADVRTYDIRPSEINNAGTYLITQQGYMMLVKSFTDDLAWSVQRELVNSYFTIPQKPISKMEMLAQAVLIAQEEIHEKDRIIEEQKPLVEFAQQVSNSSASLSIGDFAKVVRDENIALGRNKLFDWLRHKEFLMRNNVPYQKYIDKGLFEVIEVTKLMTYGTDIFPKTLITGKGQARIVEQLRKEFCKEEDLI